MKGGVNGAGRMSAATPTASGWLYLSGALTPYDVENLCEQITTLGRRAGGAVEVDVELAGAPRNSPEIRALARKVKRLAQHGVVVRLHAARSSTRVRRTSRTGV
jgi:hypothetical protein